MNTITVIVVGFFLQVFSKDLEDTWYKGCLNSHKIEQYKDSEIFNDVDSVAECSKNCFDRRFLYVGVQLKDVHVLKKDAQSNNVTGKYVTQSGYTTRDGAQSVVADQSVQSRNLEAQSTLSCVCLNISSDDVDNNCHQTQLRNSNNGLPVGVVHTTWAIYTSEGPFLTTVTIETDDGVAIVNKPVAIEIHVTRAASKNVTKDNHELGHQLDIKWSVKEEGTNFRESLSMKDLTHILHRPKYIFSQPNNYTIDIEVTNGISTLQYSHDLEVVYPAPHGLQTRISEDVDIPSCIPEEFKVTEQNGQTFEVFVDTLLRIDSAVARGTNLTFTFWFEDNDEDMVIELCENCTSISIEHMFKVTGTFKMQTSVDNVYGHLEKYTTFVVIPRQLSNLTIDLDPDSSYLVAVGQPVHFLVSLITTSRSNRSLRVWYGDHHSNTVSLADTMSPRLVLVGDGKDMEIIASYGEGCKLQLEFYYTYRTEGLYKPSVAVFEDKGIDNILDKQVNGLVDGNAKISKVRDQRVHTELDIFAEFYEYSRDAKHDNIVGDGETRSDHLDDVNADLSDELSRNILVLSKITGARIHTSRIARCNHLVEMNLLIPSALNVSVHWHIYRISDDFNDDSEETYPDDYENNDEIPASDVNENNDDLVLVFEKEIQDTSLVFMFQQVGAYLITAGVRNAVSTAEASFNIFVQCPIEGLIASCTREFIPIGAELMCMAKVERGSDIEFHWYIEGIETNTYTQFENHTSVVRHVFKRSGIYDISLHAINNVSKDYYEVVSPVHVQNPIKNINVLKESPNLLGNVTEIVGIYQPKCCGSYDLRVEFDFDFGYGRENNEVNNCIERLCYGKAKHVFNRIGTHEVNVYGYNYISEISKTVHVQIYAALDNVTVQVVGDPVAASLTRFVVLQNGKTMETADIYFSWLLGEETDVFYTNSPVVEAVFNLPGNYIVFVNLTNPGS